MKKLTLLFSCAIAAVPPLLPANETPAPVAEEKPRYKHLFRSSALTVVTENDKYFAGTDRRAYHCRLAGALGEMAASLDDPRRLVALLVTLGRRHAAHGVREEEFALASEALLLTLQDALGERFTPEVEEAWQELVGLVEAVMRRAVRRET